MGRFVLIAAAVAGAVLASCYQPNLVDCADTCTTSHLCPDGLTCTNGFCRTAGATGACTSGSAVDAGQMCPVAPQGHGTPSCVTAAPMQPALPACFVMCSPPTAGTTATMYMFNSWQSASIGSAGAEAAAKTFTNGGPIWIGLKAPAGSGAMPSAWTWSSGEPMPFMDWAPGQPVDTGGAANCGAATGSGWVSQPCAMMFPFLIGSPPPP